MLLQCESLSDDFHRKIADSCIILLSFHLKLHINSTLRRPIYHAGDVVAQRVGRLDLLSWVRPPARARVTGAAPGKLFTPSCRCE